MRHTQATEPGNRTVFAQDPQFGGRQRKALRVDDELGIVYWHRHQDKRSLEIPLADVVSPEIREFMEHVARRARETGQLPSDVWKTLAANLRSERLDAHARAICDRLRSQAERLGLNLEQYVDALERAFEWNALVHEVADAPATCAELIRRALGGDPCLTPAELVG